MKTIVSEIGLTFSDFRETYRAIDFIDEKREVIENVLNDNEDFEVDNHRFILASEIDEIQVDELSQDTYILGCFLPHFIADITGLDYKLIKRAQDGENFELLGELMLQKIEEVQYEYSRIDGYGHHFAHYDGNTIEVKLLTKDYYAFKLD